MLVRRSRELVLGLLLALLVLLPLHSSAVISTGPGGDKSWYWENPLPQGNSLQSVSFISATTGWVAGQNGTLLKTTDGGITWMPQDPGIAVTQYGQRHINSVAFTDAARGWIAGAAGLLKYSTDGGSTWTTQVVPPGVTGGINAISASPTDPNRAVAVCQGNRVIYTVNAGASWSLASTNPLGTTGNLLSVNWSDGTTAYAVGDAGAVIKSTDGGVTWTAQTSGVSVSLRSVYFAPGTATGYAVGLNSSNASTLLRTLNGGVTWTALPSIGNIALRSVRLLDANTAVIAGASGAVFTTTNASAGTVIWTDRTIAALSRQGVALNAVRLIDASHLWVAGDLGALYSSADFGATWSAQTSLTSATLRDIAATNANTVWAVGDAQTVINTTNGGIGWSGGSTGGVALRSVSFANAKFGCMVGDAGTIRWTADGGATSTDVVLPTTSRLNGFSYPPTSGLATPAIGVAVGDAGTIARTTDGGRTWSLVTPQQYSQENFNAVYMSDASNGWIVSNKGSIIRTSDGGLTWAAQKNPSAAGTSVLNAVTGIPGTGNVWIVGNGGLLWSTTDGGGGVKSWVDWSAAVGTTANLYAIDFLTTSQGWIGGANGTIIRTTNWQLATGGTWTQATTSGLPVGTPLSILGVVFADANTGYYAGDNGTIMKSVDGGQNWTAQQSPIYSQLNGVTALGTHGFIVGNGGLMLASADGGTTWESRASGANSNLLGVSFSDEQNGFYVGANGVIARTVNSAGTWTQQASGTTQQLNSIATPLGDASHALAVGNARTAVRTANAGATWTVVDPATVKTTGNLTGAWFPSATGVVVVTSDASPAVVRSADYGQTWTAATIETSASLSAVAFAPAPATNVGWAVGKGGAVYKTTDTGLTWVPQVSASPGGSALAAVSVVDSQTVYAAGLDGVIVQSHDGGTTWATQNSGWGSAGTGVYLRGVRFVDANHGFAVGDYGTILRTTSQAPPITTLTVNPPTPDGLAGWYAAAIPTIDFISDQQATTYYAWTAGGPFTARVGPVTAPQGASTLYYYSVNAANIAEKAKSAGFKVDTVAPLAPAMVSASTLSTTAVSVSWTAGSDASPGSGVATYTVYMDNVAVASTTSTGAAISGLLPNSLHTFRVAVSDRAGNSSGLSAASAIGVAAALPPLVSTAVLAPATPNASGWYTTTPTVTLSVSPSEPALTRYWWDASAPATYAGPLACASGSHALSYLSVDLAGQRAQEATVVTLYNLKIDTTPPSSPATPSVWATSPNSLEITWTPAFDPESAIDHYEVYRDGALQSMLPATATSLTVSGLTANTQYALRVVAVNGAGLSSSSATVLRHTNPNPGVFTADVSTPSVPNGANGWYVSTPTVTLIATSTSGPIPGEYIDAWWDASAPATYTAALSVPGNGTHTLSFSAVDPTNVAGREATQSLIFKLDTLAPASPGSIGATVESTSSATVSWSPGSDGGAAASGIDHYLLYVDDTRVISVTGTATVVTGLAPNAVHRFYVDTVDVAGNLSSAGGSFHSPTALIVTPPLDALVTSAAVSPAAPDGLAGWYVTVPTVQLSATQPARTYYRWDAATEQTYTAGASLMPPGDGTHWLSYWSVDEAGQTATETPKTLGLQLDTWPDVKVTGVSAVAALETTAPMVTDNQVLLGWGPATAEPPSGHDHYEVWYGASMAAVYANSYLVSGLSPATTYDFLVYDVSQAGTRYAVSETMTVTTSEAPLPEPPSRAVAQAPDGNRVFVNWEPVTSYVGAVGYHVWRSTDGVDYSRIATVTGQLNNEYTDAGRRSSTRYWYAVSTFDDRGEGSMTDTSSGMWAYTAPVTGRPQRVDGLRAIEGSGAVLLSWLTDANPAVSQYTIERSDRSLGATTTLGVVPASAAPSFVDWTAENGSAYWYRVYATDESSTVSFGSLEVLAKPHAGYSGADIHDATKGVGSESCWSCHSVHRAPTTEDASQTLLFVKAGPNEAPTCLWCHSLNSGLASTDTSSQLGDTRAISRHDIWTPTNKSGAMTCETCHAGHSSEATLTPGLLRVQGDQQCLQCHGASRATDADLSGFEQSVHAAITGPSSGSNVRCVRCHEPIASRNESLNRYSGLMVCTQCHSESTNSDAPDMWTQLEMGDESDTHHPILPSDQAKTGARIACENCHNSHTVTKKYPLIQPHNPGPDGAWTGTLNNFCFECHDGSQLPTSAETTPWAGAVLARSGATTTTDVQSVWGSSMHGYGSMPDTATAQSLLRADMGYTASGQPQDCTACHDPVGSSNAFTLKESVSSATGDRQVKGLVVYRIPASAGGGFDLRFFCKGCHTVDNAAHLEHGVDVENQFPINCTRCHRHVRANGTAGRL